MSEARAIYREAFAHYVAGRLPEAVAGYRRAVETDPNFAIAWNGLASSNEPMSQGARSGRDPVRGQQASNE